MTESYLVIAVDGGEKGEKGHDLLGSAMTIVSH